MQLSRREFLKAAAAVGLTAAEFSRIQKAVAGNGDPPVIWLQGQGCSGCSVSFLNTVYYATVDELLLNTISLEYDSTVMASAGDLAVAAASANRPSPMEQVAYNNEQGKAGANLKMDLNGDQVVDSLDYALLQRRGYILVVEGAIPTGMQKACTIGNDITMFDALRSFAQNAGAIVAVGTCASFGGISGGKPNPTGAVSVKDALASLGISKPLINIPGCPVHPDWIVGTLSYFLVNGAPPALDASGRPTDYFGKSVHSQCPNLGSFNSAYSSRLNHAGGNTCLSCHTNTDGGIRGAKMLGQSGCLYALGCKGMQTYSDCPSRRWNSPAKNQPGVNWCVDAKTPCHGCTEPAFPDGMSPFFTLDGSGLSGGTGSGTGGTVRCSDCHTGRPDGTLPSGHRTIDQSHYVTDTGGGTGGTGSTTVRCSDCHTGRPNGTLPSGHRTIDSSHYVTDTGGGTGGNTDGTGGTGSTTVRCSDCHSGRPSGTLPAGHRSIDSSHYVTNTGGGSTGGSTGGGETSDDGGGRGGRRHETNDD